MSGLTRDRTAEPAPRETKFLGANGDREKLVLSVQLITDSIDNYTLLVHTLLEALTIHINAGRSVRYEIHFRTVRYSRT